MSDERTTSRRALRNRPARRGDERERALLATAERLLGEDRFERASVAEIAAASGVSRPGFYFYFASKDALLNSLLMRTLDDLTQRLERATDDAATDPVAALRSGLHGVAD